MTSRVSAFQLSRSEEVDAQQIQQQQQQQQRQQQQRQGILNQILTAEATDRLRPQQTKQIEDIILSQVQSGRARVINEDDIINYLSQISEASQNSVKIQRKKTGLDSSDEEDAFDGL